MKRVRRLANEIQAYCAAHADAKVAAKYARYFKEGYEAWGLLDKDNPFFTERRDEWLERYQDLGIPGFIDAGALLFASGKYEEGAIAIHFLMKRSDELDVASIQGLARWFDAGIRNWAHTDGLCGQLIAPMLRSERLAPDAIAAWRTSPQPFQRRAVPVSLLGSLEPLKRPFVPSPAGRKTVKRLLDFLRPMMLDRERVVQQGLGWFLREAWKRYPREVEPFLLEFKDRAGRVIYQYATEKMSAADKARFRAARK